MCQLILFRHGLLPMAFILLIVTAQLGIIVVDRIRASKIPVEKTKDKILTITIGAANFKPSAFSRIQFFPILTGFFLLRLGRVWTSSLFMVASDLFLYLSVLLAWILLFDTTFRVIKENNSATVALINNCAGCNVYAFQSFLKSTRKPSALKIKAWW